MSEKTSYKRKVLWKVLLMVTVLLAAIGWAYYYNTKAERDISRITEKVADLFVEYDEESYEKNKIKDTTTQAQIDWITDELDRMDFRDKRYEKYSLAVLALYQSLRIAQEQLDGKHNKNATDPFAGGQQEFEMDPDLSAIENLIVNFPDIQHSLEEVPYDMQSKILIPSLEDIPFFIEDVYLDYSNNQRPSLEVHYSGAGISFTSFVWYYDGELSEKGEMVELAGNRTGRLDAGNSDDISIDWQDAEEGSRLHYRALLSGKGELSEELLIRLANSMIANEANVFIHPDFYQPEDTDVVLKNNVLENMEILDAFIEVAGTDNESEVRIVKYIIGQGAILYDLKSRYDASQDVGWIEVVPDLSNFFPKEDEGQDVFNRAPQQCGSLDKDLEEGFYKLYECRTHWEYHLLPIPGRSILE